MESNEEVLQVFRTALLKVTLLFAPIAPFISEIIYQNLPNTTQDSIHLELWPKSDPTLIDQDLEEKVEEVKKAIEKVHATRKQANLKTRQPLSKVTIFSPVESPQQNLLDVIAKEVNVKLIRWQSGNDLKVELDTHLTSELLEEGVARELIRKIQDERKKMATELDEQIEVTLTDWPKAFESEIMAKVKATKINKGDTFSITRHAGNA